jgi:hypothetical protein
MAPAPKCAVGFGAITNPTNAGITAPVEGVFMIVDRYLVVNEVCVHDPARVGAEARLGGEVGCG